MILHFFLIRSTRKNDILPLRNDDLGAKRLKIDKKHSSKRVFFTKLGAIPVIDDIFEMFSFEIFWFDKKVGNAAISPQHVHFII